MKNLRSIGLLSILLFVVFTSNSQDSLVDILISKNVSTFSFNGKEFQGEGWNFIQKKITESSNVLIGEDHFSNEIPYFTRAVFNVKKFDNFFIEVDPYSTQIIVNSIKNTKENQSEFYDRYKDLFSFYALEPEFNLLTHVVNSGTNILGTDQIVAYADQLIFNDLQSKTNHKTAKEIYTYIVEQSRFHLEEFFKDTKNPMYFMTPDFTKQLSRIDSLNLSKRENEIIKDLKKSLSIYKQGGHKERIQLMMHQLMKSYPLWKNAQNLYKYGAMHLARGESFLTINDIGNVIANITESNYEKSYHIMVIGESGMKGGPFRIFPPSEVNIDSGILKSFRPLFDITNDGREWYLFNLIPLREAMENGTVKIDDPTLLRAIKGYDSIVIIPKLTPAKF